MDSTALIAPEGGGGATYVVEKLWEGVRRETTCERDCNYWGSNFSSKAPFTALELRRNNHRWLYPSTPSSFINETKVI
jgi:hypothetical protein